MPLLGAHQPIAGGLHLAFDRIERVGGEALQIFTANQRQWRTAPLQPEAIDRFRERWARSKAMPVASHASYLINLAGGADKAEQSVAGFAEELRRCLQLGIDMVVIHPGSHGGAGVDAGVERAAQLLDLALERAGALGADLKVLLETTAGQGTSLGSRFEELGWLLAASRFPEHLGVCVDTCHIFAAGYDFRTAEGYARTMALLERHVGLDRIFLLHLNDSRKECGSRVDRHEHIGEGRIGREGFRFFLSDSRLARLPMILETDKGDDLAEDVENLRLLRTLAA
ncbi:MAG: deoxyribonuclease IV [Desulfobulbus sp.]|uniref:deoxyribonuclease IV n=1 Tax=Desulfobulbus sp. TaxID=895 RepID=UPI00284E96A0|nr:deoxyribonuclease IV [Desulfobulbus sp.]MDR2549684.1 deoxyribonuclease IV [Desulfobulbus sp.]